jgi:predicted Zn-dependent protease
MGTLMSDRPALPPQRPLSKLPKLTAALFAAFASSCALAQMPAPAHPSAAEAAGAAPEAPIVNSAMDDRLLYQLLVGEMALTSGDPGSAYELILDAAKRTKDEALFRRAVNIALESRAGDQALAATKAWRSASPKSLDAARLQLQILLLLNKASSANEPLKLLLAQTPPAELRDLISSLPRLLQRSGDPKAVATLIDEALKPYRSGGTAVVSRVAQGRSWLEAKDPDRALTLATEAQSLEAAAPGPAMLGLELMRERPAAEQLVQSYLKQGKAEPALRMTYVRVLTASQRYADAVQQLELLTQQQPENAGPYLSLGALHLELAQRKEGEAALLRYVDLVQQQMPKAADGTALPTPAPKLAKAQTDNDTDDSEGGDEEEGARPEQGLLQAWLMLAQSAEQRGDFAAAEQWLGKVDDPQRALEVQTRRASMMARQGKLVQARELIRSVPERRAEDGRAKVIAEAGLLRNSKDWKAAFDVLAAGNQRYSGDPDLLYEQAMMAEKIDRTDEMEKLLRAVIQLKPDNAHAHNALGYSLADRRQRLPEAKQLIKRALELAPGDPFITDSLGWVEYRMGNHAEAIRVLRGAYVSRPDPEIAAHLGEVLWADGQRDEARRVWAEARSRDAGNDVLRETLARLRVDL